MMFELVILALYCSMCIFFGRMLKKMSSERKYRTTERVKMSFYSGAYLSSSITACVFYLIWMFG